MKNDAPEDENRRLRELLNLASNHLPLSQLTLRENIDAALSYAAPPASGEAEDRAQDAMRAQVYPDLWPGPSLGQTAPPPPPTQGEEEIARSLVTAHVMRHRRPNNQGQHIAEYFADELTDEISAALRQRADEAMRAENEACALTVETYYAGDIAKEIAKSIRARIARDPVTEA